MTSIRKIGLLTTVTAMTIAFSGTAQAKNIWKQGNNGSVENAARLSPADLAPRAEAAARNALGQSFALKRSNTDKRGVTHIRMDQTLRGKKIRGADIVMHVGANGSINLINGKVVETRGVGNKASIDADVALTGAAHALGIANYTLNGKHELAYAVGKGDTARLSWKSTIEYTQGNEWAVDDIYTDALTGEIVLVDPQVHTAKNRRTYDANGEAYNSRKMPGTLVCGEGDTNCGPQDAQDAHDYAGVTYDYFAVKFGRDSLDNAGMDLVSSVNVCGSRRCPNNWNNAAWFNNQMLYGEGDGSTFSPLSGDLDVVAHELTHGVTDFTSDLIYRDQSGALNEALSDIFGASAEAWNEGGINGNTWKLGEDIYTPGAAGDALRYMNNPTLDGQSTDYFPDRVFEGTSTDNGGVHLNSGIFNLAYVLLVEGGTHPRGVTSTNVPGIGMDKAEQIYYHANVNYFTSSTGYDAALAALSQSALDLYGATERDAVVASYCAVGVGSGCSGGPVDPPGPGDDTTPPVISGVTSASTGRTTFRVSWTTDEPTTGVVAIGSTTASSPLGTSHTVNFSGARKNRSYTYTITATDESGNSSSTSATHRQN